MNTVKKLPLAMAVVAALCPISVMAQEFTQEQIDAIVAKAVDKALAGGDRPAQVIGQRIGDHCLGRLRQPDQARRCGKLQPACVAVGK